MKSPSNNSNIQSLIRFKMTERKDLFMHYKCVLETTILTIRIS